MLQPFKYITVVMEKGTNGGMVEDPTRTPYIKPIVRLTGDKRGWPVTLKDDGVYGEIFSAANESKATIGVLMESFHVARAQHKVLVHGIVPMPAAASVKAGQQVFWDYTNNRLTSTKSTTQGSMTPYVGRAMGSSTADGDMVDVLIS